MRFHVVFNQQYRKILEIKILGIKFISILLEIMFCISRTRFVPVLTRNIIRIAVSSQYDSVVNSTYDYICTVHLRTPAKRKKNNFGI